MPHYQHTQIGWVQIGIAGAVAALLGFIALQTGSWPMGIILVAGLAPMFLFSTMTTVVTEENLRVRFGPGLIRFDVPIGEVTAWTRVRNPWSYGWGMRSTPSGRLYNVSGLDAVELTLADGRAIRVGTDEPDRLMAALEQVARNTGTAVGTPSLAASSERKARVAIFVMVLVPVTLVLVTTFYFGTRPVTVTFSPSAAVVHGGAYSDEIAFDSIESVSLEPALPPILWRTNGLAVRGTLRGSFKLRDGSAHLFVERDHPPFVAVRTKRDFVLVNFKDRSETERLYERLKASQAAR